MQCSICHKEWNLIRLWRNEVRLIWENFWSLQKTFESSWTRRRSLKYSRRPVTWDILLSTLTSFEKLLVNLQLRSIRIKSSTMKRESRSWRNFMRNKRRKKRARRKRTRMKRRKKVKVMKIVRSRKKRKGRRKKMISPRNLIRLVTQRHQKYRNLQRRAMMRRKKKKKRNLQRKLRLNQNQFQVWILRMREMNLMLFQKLKRRNQFDLMTERIHQDNQKSKNQSQQILFSFK